MEQQQAVKRGAIVGTAPTYRDAPWADPAVDIFGLNDGYVLPHMKRASGWFDLHPIPEMVFRPKGERIVHPSQAPVGGYLRPEGHLDWLRSRAFPVYLHDCREAGCADIPPEKRSHDPYPFPDWPNARPFPFKAIRQQLGPLGDYVQSTPAWMLVWMTMVEQYRGIGIFGIHLATEWEYINQRPNMEFLIGMTLAQGIQFEIPYKSSLLKGKHVYALEPKPHLDLERVERQAQLIKAEGAQLQHRLAKLPWYARSEKADLVARLKVLDLELMDTKQEMGRLSALARVA